MSEIKIGIIIPCYYSFELLKKLLNSLKEQTCRNNIVVYLINNKTEYPDLIKEYNSFFQIVYIENKNNLGPGAARQIGLNYCKEDYILFIDDDDCLAHNQVIEKYLYYAEKGYNIISSLHLNIVETNNQFQYKTEQFDLIYVVGDLFKKSFLDKYNIHFHKENSFYCEHAYFLKQVYHFIQFEQNKTYVKIPEIFYLVYHYDKIQTITWKNSFFLEEQIISEALQLQFYQEHINELTINEKISIINILSSYYHGNDLILAYFEQNGFHPLLKNKQTLYKSWLYIIDLIYKNQDILKNKNKNGFSYLRNYLDNYQKYNFYDTFEQRFKKLN